MNLPFSVYPSGSIDKQLMAQDCGVEQKDEDDVCSPLP